MGFWNRHPGWFTFGAIALIIAGIFALPIVLFCLFWQAMFMLAIFVLDIILPGAIVIAGFDLGTGFLNTGIGAAIGFFLLLGRWTIDIIKIKWIYILTDAIFMIGVVGVAFQDYAANTSMLLSIPGALWAFICTSAFLKGLLAIIIFAVVIGLCVLGLIENNEIKQDVQNGTYVRRFEPPQWLAWAKVENVYGLPVSAMPQPSDQHPTEPQAPPPAPVVQNTPVWDREAWYKQLAKENAQQARRRP